MFEIGLSTTGKNINDELFAAYTDSGIKHAEISATYDNYNFVDYRYR